MISDILIFLIVLIALTIGWAIGRNQGRKQSKTQYLDSDYFVGLNYLLDDKPDKAVAALVDSLEVNSDTIEVHLAIARIFRKQGEIERAIQVHQNLFARPGLPRNHSAKIQFELAKDYYAAGIYERAEHLLLELTSTQSSQRLDSYNLLVDIYIQEKDWQKAIEAAEHLNKKELATKDIDLSHFYCALAQEQVTSDDFVSARKSLKKAFALDKSCSRALWQLGEIEYKANHYKDAIKHIKKAVSINSNFVTETLDVMHDSYMKTNNLKGWLQFLEQIYVQSPSNDVLLRITQHYHETEGAQQAYEVLKGYLAERISIKGMQYLYEHFHKYQLDEKFDKTLYDSLFSNLLEKQHKYDCFKCGYKTDNYYWLCPSCKSWSSFQLRERR